MKIKDNWIIGIGMGLLLPAFAGWAYFAYLTGNTDIVGFAQGKVGRSALAPLFALGCVLNLGLFFLFYSTNRLKAAQGVIVTTLIYVVITVYLKYF